MAVRRHHGAAHRDRTRCLPPIGSQHPPRPREGTRATSSSSHGQLSHNRSLVRFDQATIASAVGTGTLTTATLELQITDNGNNWGATGRTISVYWLTSAWAEGNGFVDLGHPPNRGSGPGATWACAIDADISDQGKDCSGPTAWEMGKPNQPELHPWVEPATSSALITNGLTGTVTFDVTADVQTFGTGGAPNYGWIVKKDLEGPSSLVQFASRETGNGPRLVLAINRPPSETSPPTVSSSGAFSALDGQYINGTECGIDMSVFPSVGHFASWAGICPGTNTSAGKRYSGKTRRGSKWLRQALSESAQAAARTKGTYLASHYAQIRGRGTHKAIGATRHDILVAYYHIVRDRVPIASSVQTGSPAATRPSTVPADSCARSRHSASTSASRPPPELSLRQPLWPVGPPARPLARGPNRSPNPPRFTPQCDSGGASHFTAGFDGRTAEPEPSLHASCFPPEYGRTDGLTDDRPKVPA